MQLKKKEALIEGKEKKKINKQTIKIKNNQKAKERKKSSE